MPLSPYFTSVLKKQLTDVFVPHLPALIKPSTSQVENDRKNISRAFSAFVLHKLCGAKVEAACKSVIDDFDDIGIDAICYQAPTLYVVQGKLKESETFSEAEALKFKNGVEKLVESDFADFNKHFSDNKAVIEKALDECDHIQLVVAHTGSGVSKHAANVLNSYIQNEKSDGRISGEYIDLDAARIVDFLISDKSHKRVDTDIFIKNHAIIDEPYETIFGSVSLKHLVDIHNKYGVALYEKNIRTYLGLRQRQGVNESIQKTLTDDPENFFYLNNGVTALYETKKEKTKKDGVKGFSVTGLSVINGAQTISSAATLGAQPENLEKAKVMITLIHSSAGSDFGKSVTKARNHQNPVNISDFIALEEIQERLRKECALSDFIYEFKAGQSPISGGNVITLQQAIQSLTLRSNDPRYPIWLKKEPSTLHNVDSPRYKALYPDSLTGIAIINARILDWCITRLISNLVAAASALEKGTYKHGAYALAWCFSKKCRAILDWPTVLNSTAVSKAISHPFDEFRNLFWEHTHKAVGSVGQPGPLAVFKNQSHSLPLMRKIMAEAFGLVADPVLPIKLSQVKFTDPYPNAAAFDYMISKAPQIELSK